MSKSFKYNQYSIDGSHPLFHRPQRITYKTLLGCNVTSEPDVLFEQTFNLSGPEPVTPLMMICEVGT